MNTSVPTDLYARVILDIPTRALDTTFDYAIPPELAATAQVGCCVRVEFAHRQHIGYLVKRSEVLAEGIDASAVKPIEAVLSEPYFDKAAAELAQWIAREYLAPLSEAIRLFTPPGFTPRLERDADGLWVLTQPGVGAVDDRWVFLTEEGRSFTPPAQAVKQRAIIEALRIGEMRIAELSIDISNP
ncbi:MAG: primosomal protein N', partial [Coriobacteriia bacterium]|nr:primosomal protein N' [Coriobacteriia bacterium]